MFTYGHVSLVNVFLEGKSERELLLETNSPNLNIFLTCECNEQVIGVNRFGTQSVGRSVDQLPVNLLT